MKDNHIEEIVTNKGTVKPGLVICAAGIYSRKIGEMVGMDAHVKPERGFCLVSEKCQKSSIMLLLVQGRLFPEISSSASLRIKCRWTALTGGCIFVASNGPQKMRCAISQRFRTSTLSALTPVCAASRKISSPLLDQRTRSTTSGSTLHTVPLHTILCFRTTLQRWSQASVRMILCRNTFILVLTSNRKEIKIGMKEFGRYLNVIIMCRAGQAYPSSLLPLPVLLKCPTSSV